MRGASLHHWLRLPSHPSCFQFVDIATGEKASKGFDHRASVSMCVNAFGSSARAMRCMIIPFAV